MEITVQQKNLFATRVWEFDCSVASPHYAMWRQCVEAMRQTQPSAAGRSNRQGWNSEKTLFRQAEFAPLRQLAAKAMQVALQQMGVAKPVFALEAWANVNDPGGYNLSHVHAGTLLSACFYLTVPEGAGAIVLHDPRPGAMHSVFQGKGVNNCQAVAVKPREGLLLVFPAWLEHHVNVHQGSEPRVSIAMNALQARFRQGDE